MKKSTLRTLFIVSVLLSSVAFIGLTVNTLIQLPARTHAENLTAQAVNGKLAWQRHDCTDCHTLLGNGAYYAPDLTKVAQRRGGAFLNAWLPAPAGQMPNQKLTAAEVADLVAYLTWVSNIDTNRWPPAPIIASAPTATPSLTDQQLVTTGGLLFETKTCAGCHGVNGRGTPVAPSLVGITTRRDTAYLTLWLHNPAAVMPGTLMPNLGLTDSDIQALLAYIATLK